MANIKNRKKLQLIQTIWDVMLYSQHFTFHWKLLGLVSRIEKSGTGDNNFGKWKGTFRSDRLKWPDRSQWTTFKAGPEYSGRTKRKWSVPFDELTEISGLLGWMESAPYLTSTETLLRLPKNRWIKYSRESANPISVLLLSFESQTVFSSFSTFTYQSLRSW